MGGDSGEGPKTPGYVKRATKPYAAELSQFNKNYNPEFYGGTMSAGMDPYTESAVGRMGQFSTQPTQDYLQSTMQGDYLGLSDPMRNAVMDPAMDSVAARMASMGRYGSPASQAQMLKAGMGAVMPYYNQERGRQQQASMVLPGMQELEMQKQLQAGGIREGFEQRGIEEDVARFNFEQNKPYNIMQKWASLYAPLGQMQTPTAATQGEGSTMAGVAGGALAGAGTGAAIGSVVPGIGTAMGAGAGALLGGLTGYYGTQ
jgi:hypothetical protein